MLWQGVPLLHDPGTLSDWHCGKEGLFRAITPSRNKHFLLLRWLNLSFRHHHLMLNENLSAAFTPPLHNTNMCSASHPHLSLHTCRCTHNKNTCNRQRASWKKAQTWGEVEYYHWLVLLTTPAWNTCWLRIAAQLVVEQDAELAEEADKYTKVKIYLEDQAVEISNYLEVVSFWCMEKGWNAFLTLSFLAQRSKPLSENCGNL